MYPYLVPLKPLQFQVTPSIPEMGVMVTPGGAVQAELLKIPQLSVQVVEQSV